MKKNTHFTLNNANTLMILSAGVLIGLLAVLTSFWVGRTWKNHQILNQDINHLPSPAVDFSLKAASGEAHSIRALYGKIILLSFGATTCNQPCDDMLSKLASARTDLGADKDHVQVIILALDSEQDSPAALTAYVQKFDPSFLALSGSKNDLNDIARSYDVIYSTVKDYQPAAMLIDPQGQWQEVYTSETNIKEITTDMQQYLSYH
ncbi:MAG: SCO family protein [Chloroflexota bacterium]